MMAKNRPTSAHLRTQSKPRTPKHEGKKQKHASVDPEQGGLISPAAVREIVESIVIAFVLAFLFRTFEAEAFVIPTGSMAPTLMGRHKDLTCARCGFPFQVSASDEFDNETNLPKNVKVISCTCPNCRFTMDLDDGNPQGETYRSYKGDRILVGKFPYQFGAPDRWDVAVFKYPGGAKTNYIKRIVGLPSEWLRISHGDVFTQPILDGRNSPSPDAWIIARKPPEKLRSMLQTVYDNDYALPWMIREGWPARWGPLTSGGPGEWATSEDFRWFETDGSAEGDVWIRYRHFVPSYFDWQQLDQGGIVQGNHPKPQLITDFTAYNTEKTDGQYYLEPSQSPPHPHQLGLHWVGDLAIEAEVEVESDSGHLILELVEGGRRFGCRIDVATGKAILSIDGPGTESFQPSASTVVRGPGSYELLFANVDDQLTLWVNGRVVRFDAGTSYGPLDNALPTPADLEPVRIGSRGAKVRVKHLKLSRDIYYIAERARQNYSHAYTDPYSGHLLPPVIADYDFQTWRSMDQEWLHRRTPGDLLSDTTKWRDFAAGRNSIEFKVDKDQYLVLGDNSAESKDSRLWGAENLAHYVSRELLIGKALVIYWPHSLDRIPYLNIPIRFFPNFKRMWVVR
jgi:signal peptidase I